MNHIETLKEHGACSDGIAFAEQYGSMNETIQACTRSSWLRWALRMIADKRKRVGIAAHIVRNTPLKDGRTVYDLLTDERSRKALDVCDAYSRGEATDDGTIVNTVSVSGGYYNEMAPFSVDTVGWAPIVPLKRKARFVVEKSRSINGTYIVRNTRTGICTADSLPTESAAQRIADIYNEVMP